MRSGNRQGGAQRGAALIIALLVVALVVTLAVTMASDFLLLFRRVENQLDSEQAWAYLVGGESLARAALLADLRDERGRTLDSSAEVWARPQRLPTDRGWIVIELIDLQARFNLNALVSRPAPEGDEGDPEEPSPGESPPPATSGYSPAQERLIRLLQVLPLQEPMALEQAQALTEAITDWVDEDDLPTGFGGAESAWYAGAEPPGRAANQPFAAPSELRWVRGMTPAIWQALAPLVSVWPTGNATFNVNVAITLETLDDPVASLPARLLLATLNAEGDLTPLPPAMVDALLREQVAAGGFQSLEALTAGALSAVSIDTTGLAVQSNWFQLNSETELNGRRFRLHSVLVRDPQAQAVRTVARTSGEW